MKIVCEELSCIFNADKGCIRDEISITDNGCVCKCLVSADELAKIKDYHFKGFTERIKEELEQARFKSSNLQKQVEENDKIIEELKKGRDIEAQHKPTNEILDNARKLAHPRKSGKGKNLKDMYSTSDLEDMYIGQGLSCQAIANITGAAKSTVYDRLKNAGIIDKKKQMDM